MRGIAIVAVVSLLCGGSALGASLATDPSAATWDGTTWRGSVMMTEGDLSARVEYCVYGPGDYPGTNYTPDEDEFVYAYQVFALGDDGILTFSVRMLESNEANDISHDTSIGVAGDVVETGANFAYPPGLQNDLAYWDFGGFAQPDKSVALVFSTVNAPMWLDGRVQNGGYAEGDLPSPSDVIPEPATIAVLLAGAVGLIRRRR